MPNFVFTGAHPDSGAGLLGYLAYYGRDMGDDCSGMCDPVYKRKMETEGAGESRQKVTASVCAYFTKMCFRCFFSDIFRFDLIK